MSYTRFLAIWREEWPNAKMPKWNKFAKCKCCVKFERDISKERDRDKREVLLQSRLDHYNYVFKERREYYHHQELARKYPDK